METTALSGTIGTDHYRVTLRTARHSWHGDEPQEAGGSDTAPAPSELVLSGLAACKLITLRGYADRKEWSLTRIHLELEMEVDSAVRPVKTRIQTRLTLEGALTEEQRARLHEVAGKCPVHRMLTGEIDIK